MLNYKSFYQVVCFIQLSEAGVLSVYLKMDKTGYRAVIKFFVIEGLTPNEIHSKSIKLYGDSSPSFSTIKKWAAEFKRGRTSLEDDPREGHPPYSPDLAPSDFCLFPKHKLFLAGQLFSSNREAIAAIEGYFADLTKNHYRDGIMALEHRWNKCISLKGDYVEK